MCVDEAILIIVMDGCQVSPSLHAVIIGLPPVFGASALTQACAEEIAVVVDGVFDPVWVRVTCRPCRKMYDKRKCFFPITRKIIILFS